MKKIYTLSLLSILLGLSQNVSAYKVTVKWDNPGTVLVGLGSPRDPELLTISPEQTEYVYEGDSYTELCVFPAAGYVLTKVTQSDQPDKNNSIMPNATYCQQSYYGVADSWDGRVISVETDKITYDGELSIDVVNGADCLNAFLDSSRSEGTGTLKYSYGYQSTLSLADGNNAVPFSSEYMKNLTIDLKSGTPVKSIYSVTRNGESQAPIGTSYYMTDILPTDKIEVRVYENEAPKTEEVTFTLSYPEEIAGCIRNLFDRTNSKFLGMDADYNFSMPADHSFTVTKGSEIQVNFNEGYTLTGFTLNGEDVTELYSSFSNRIILTVNENAVLAIVGEETKYADVEFTAYVLNADGVRLGLETYQSLPNPIKDVTGQQGEKITENIDIPSYSFNDKDAGSGEDGTSSTGNAKVVPATVMTPENTLKFTVKVSERSPLIYISPVVGYYIQSVWDSSFSNPLTYIDGSEESQRVFYVVAQKLDRDSQFKVEVDGSNPVEFSPCEYFQRNWDNPSISFAIGEGEKTYDYNVEYDNPFTLHPMVQYAGFDVTLNGRQAGITKTELGTYIIDFTQAYVTDRYPIPTLKVKAGGASGVDEVEAAEADEKALVYNLQGISLGSDWDSLPAGLYIRNGKKIVKK